MSLTGRTIRVVAPARWVEEELLSAFATLASTKGASVQIAPQCTMHDDQLAGPDFVRAAALNEAIADDAVDIIWCARGGYGSPRLLGAVEFGAARRDKLFVGYSDMTALQQNTLTGPLKPLHAAMPFDMRREGGADNIERALHLCGEILAKSVAPRTFDLSAKRAGAVDAPLIAANLHVLTALLGTRYEPTWPDCILCVEDIGEYYYAIDRLFWRLSQSRLAPRIKGLVLGEFVDTEDNETPWGASIEEIAALHFPVIPIATGMPMGHGVNNKPLLLSAPANLRVGETTATLTT